MCPSETTNLLGKGDPLPDEDEISRYCPPWTFDKRNDLPSFKAFRRKPREEDLSVNHLQYYSDLTRTEAVDQIRHEMGQYYDLEPGSRFVVLSVGKVKESLRSVKIDPSVVFTPEPDKGKFSHSSIFGLPPRGDQLERDAAISLARLVTPGDVYPGDVP